MSTQPDLTGLLALAVERQASDLHIHCGTPPLARVYGQVVPITEQVLDAEACYYIVFSGLTETQRARLQQDLELDFVLDFPELGRFRCNAHYSRGCVEAVYRHIRSSVQDLETLGHRPIVTELCRRTEGLILVTGHSGAGKTTTMASMVQQISRFRSGVIITIEDPIEYSFSPALSVIKQREVGTDTKSFAAGLRHAARQDPDVIVIGEMRDPETMHAAVTTQLANSLLAVISQRLLPRADGQGRVLAVETMIANPGIRACIRDHKPHMIIGQIEIGGQEGMNTLDESLARLTGEGLITYEVALANARDPERIPKPEMKKKKGLFG